MNLAQILLVALFSVLSLCITTELPKRETVPPSLGNKEISFNPNVPTKVQGSSLKRPLILHPQVSNLANSKNSSRKELLSSESRAPTSLKKSPLESILKILRILVPK